jgi:hypothetical protein
MEARKNNLKISKKSEKKKSEKEIIPCPETEITMNQLAEIIINSYLRKHPELLYNNSDEGKHQLNNAA